MDHELCPKCRGNLLHGRSFVSFSGNGILVGAFVVLLMASPVILTGASPGLTPNQTTDTKPAISGKAAEPASGEKAPSAPVPSSKPYLAVDNAYVQDGFLHIVIRNTAAAELSPELVRKGRVQIRLGKETVAIPIAGMQRHKGIKNTWHLNTGLAFESGQSMTFSMWVEGDSYVIRAVTPLQSCEGCQIYDSCFFKSCEPEYILVDDDRELQQRLFWIERADYEAHLVSDHEIRPLHD